MTTLSLKKLFRTDAQGQAAAFFDVVADGLESELDERIPDLLPPPGRKRLPLSSGTAAALVYESRPARSASAGSAPPADRAGPAGAAGVKGHGSRTRPGLPWSRVRLSRPPAPCESPGRALILPIRTSAWFVPVYSQPLSQPLPSSAPSLSSVWAAARTDLPSFGVHFAQPDASRRPT